jgi:carbamoylphosphate synthase large subunit
MTNNDRPAHNIALVNAETGETVISTYLAEDATEWRKDEFKGWVLRWRTAQKRRHGIKLLVVKIDQWGEVVL